MIEILEEISPLPGKPVNATGDWEDTEKGLSLVLPADYKLIINKYGDFNWNDFLWLFNPFTDNINLNLAKKSREICGYETGSRKEYPHYYPLGIYPETGGLFPWAVTDNGDYLFWITSGKPELWPTLIKSAREPEFEVHFMQTHLILYHIINGSLNTMVLPR